VLSAAPTNRFVGAAGTVVGAATVPAAPIIPEPPLQYIFFVKKIKLPTRAPPNHPVTSKIHDQVS